jgi:hypothetical protein
LGPPVLAGVLLAPTVALVVLGFVAVVACVTAVGIGCAVALTVIADAFIDRWEKRKR